MLLLWLPLLRLGLLLGLLSMLLRLGLLLGLLSMLLWLRLLLFGLGLLFVSLLLLSVDLDDSSGKRNKGGQGHYLKKFHVDSRFSWNFRRST
jgi:Zn-dependent membrane protease YugP